MPSVEKGGMRGREVVSDAAPCVYDYSIAIFGVNEGQTIGRCLQSVDSACAGRRAHIAVLLNGTTDRSAEIVRSTPLRHASVSVYRFPAADKANCINWFMHKLRCDAGMYFCVDAYAEIAPGAFQALTEALRNRSKALIASGIPSRGRSAKVMAEKVLMGGGLDGRLYAMRPSFVERFVAAKLRLPLGLYRVDGLIGAMAAYDLDSAGTGWDEDRITGAAEATFAIRPLSIFRWNDVRRQYNREIRQARGRLENQAMEALVKSRGFEGLPSNARDMVRSWLPGNLPAPRSWRERYFMKLALRQISSPFPGPGQLLPKLVHERLWLKSEEDRGA